MPRRSDKLKDAFDDAEQYTLPYISKSRVMQWKKNPEHFRLKYMEDIAQKETIPMKRGTAIHETFEHYYNEVQGANGFLSPKAPEALPPDYRLWADFTEPYITNFFAWEKDRWEAADKLPERYKPVGIEQEVWRDDLTDGIEWMGIADAVLPAESISQVDADDGVVIVDFKTGKVPAKKYREEGIYLELEYYHLLFGNEYDVVAAAAYYPRTNELLVMPQDEGRREVLLDTVADMVSAVDGYDGTGTFDINPGPLCKWGTDDDQESAYYGICSKCTWGVPAKQEERFRELVDRGFGNTRIAEEMNTTTNAVGYWKYKMGL